MHVSRVIKAPSETKKERAKMNVTQGYGYANNDNEGDGDQFYKSTFELPTILSVLGHLG